MSWQQPMAQGSAVAPIPPDERTRILSQTVQGEVIRGARVQSQDAYSAVLVYGKPVNHVLHAVLTLLFLGLWVVVWLYFVITGGESRRMFTVDEFGRIGARDV